MKLLHRLSLIALTALMGAALAGCANKAPLEHGSVIQTTIKADGSKVVTENRSDYANYANTKKELADKPLFRLVCPPLGCVLASLEVSNPHAAADIAAPAAAPKVESAAVGVAREFKEALGLLAPIAMATTVGSTVSKLFTAFGGSTAEIAARIQAPAANVTINKPVTTNVANTNSGNTSSVANTNSGNTSTTATTNTTNTTNTSTATTTTNTGAGGSVRGGG